MSPPMISKAAARYTGAGGKEHCSLCRHFSPRRGGRCARVLGDISPMGWCKLFSREMRGLVADASSFNGGGGPALGLDFMVPGSLDPRITFTRASTGTYFNSAGVMQSAATNTPRWDYDPATLALRGLLIEEARINVVFQSNDLSNANFASYQVATLTGNAVVAPNGLTQGAQITTSGAPGGRYNAAGNPLSFNSGTAYTTSCYFKWVSGPTTLMLAVASQANFGGTGGDRTLQFNGQTGAFVSKSTEVSSYSVADAGNGWWRASGTFTPTSSATGAVAAYASASGTTFAAWGLQSEAGTFATSYIPTTSAAVTREVDVCGMPAANTGWFVSPGGSWFAEFISISPLVATSFRRIVTTNAAASVAPITLDNTASKLGQFGGGSLFTTNAITVGAVAKGATAWTTGAATCCLNGGTVASSAGLTGFAAIATNGLRLLTNLTPAEGMNGYIRRVQYWSRILTPAELQTVTSP